MNERYSSIVFTPTLFVQRQGTLVGHYVPPKGLGFEESKEEERGIDDDGLYGGAGRGLWLVQD